MEVSSHVGNEDSNPSNEILKLSDINVDYAHSGDNISKSTGGADDILQQGDILLVPHSKVPKDSKLAWVKCFAAFLIQVCIVGILHVFGVFFVAFINDFQTSKATAAWVGSAAYGLTMAFGPIASVAISRFGVRATICTGSLMCSTSMIVSSFVPSMGWLFLTFSLVFGLGTSLAYSPTMTIAEDYFSKYLSVATGITVSGSSFGTLILSPISQYLLDSFGWRGAMRILSAVCALGFICGLAFEPRIQKPDTAAERVKRSPISRLVADLHLWKNRVYVVWVIAITCVMFGYYIPYVHLVSHAMTLGIPASKGSILMLTLGASTATGRIMFGKIITFGVLDRLHMHQLSMVITGVACMMMPLIKTFAGLMTYVICVGLVDGCFVVMMPLLTVTLVGVENKVLAWGYLVGVSSVTFMLGPPVAGWIFDATGSYNTAFHVAAVPILIGPAILLFIPWAQRTGNTVNDALSVAGDVDTEGGSLGSCDGVSMMSAWAAPSRPSHRGSQRSSLRSLAFSNAAAPKDSSMNSRRRRTPSQNIDIRDIHLSVSGTRRPQQTRHGSEGLLPGERTQHGRATPDLVCATSLEAHCQNIRRCTGRRCRSVSESTDDRGIHWSDQVSSIRTPRESIQSDPEKRNFSLLDPDGVSNNQHMVEVCDDLLGIFRETSTNQSYSNRSAVSAGPVSIGSPSISMTSTPIPISQNQSSTSSTAAPQDQDSHVWTSPVGSPPRNQLSPTLHHHSPPQIPVGAEMITNGSPPWSSQLVSIPENKQLLVKENCFPPAIERCFPVQQDQANNVPSGRASRSDPNQTHQGRTGGSDVVASQQTESSVSVHSTSSTSATQADTQIIFPLDVSEGSTDEIACADKNLDVP